MSMTQLMFVGVGTTPFGKNALVHSWEKHTCAHAANAYKRNLYIWTLQLRWPALSQNLLDCGDLRRVSSSAVSYFSSHLLEQNVAPHTDQRASVRNSRGRFKWISTAASPSSKKSRKNDEQRPCGRLSGEYRYEGWSLVLFLQHSLEKEA